MRFLVRTFVAGLALLPCEVAHAAEQLKVGAPPAWVRQQSIPNSKPTDAPVAILLNDQQIAFEPGKMTSYTELAFRVQNAQGLAAGNVSIGWQPSTDTVTVNKLQIRRGDKVIDVLAAGQTFQTLRRETNLDAAMLDGTLTANIQPEGLQEGDIIDLATTTERSDPVMKGHVEAVFAGWNGVPIELGHASISWPKATNLSVKRSDGLPQPRTGSTGDRTTIDLTATKIEPLIPPKGAPQRFKIGRIAEASDFKSWSDVAELFVPLYRDARVIPSAGPLHDEVERIAASTTDPKQRAERALALAQDRVRYVALLMGPGAYVPASAETTWSRRFGDCKGKTALLLGILHSFGIDSEAVLVNSGIGDAIAERLPMAGLFNHVLVRARIGGKDYWLDGTRTGDSKLDEIATPNFGWGLPLVEKAALVRLVPSPLSIPGTEHSISIDASGGIYSAAAITVTEIYRSDAAVQLNTIYSALSGDQRNQMLSELAKKYFGGFEVSSSTGQSDKAKREFTILIKGRAKLDWNKGWFSVPTSSISFDPDFDRPPGPLHDVPVAVNHPRFVKDLATLTLPAGFAARQELDAPVHETLAGVEYARTEKVIGNVLTVDSSERSLTSEVPYKDAQAAAPRLRALSKDDVYLKVPSGYRPSEADLKALPKEELRSAESFIDRGNTLLNGGQYVEAIADFNKALELEPKNVVALADRAFAYVYTQKPEAAAKDIAAAENIDSTNAVLNRVRGLVAERNGDFKAAVAAYSKSLEAKPHNAFALGHRAFSQRALGNDDGALADADLALKENAGWLELRLLRANILLAQGKHDAVAAEADLIVRDNPQTEYSWVAAGRIYARVGRNSKAMEAFDRALAIKSEAYVYINRAQSRPSSDRAGRMGDLQKALTLKPDDVDTIALVASEYESAGDLKRALALYDQLVVRSPGFSVYDVMRAAVLHKAGRTAEAEKVFVVQRKKAKTAADFNALCWTKATAGIMLESALQNCRDALKMEPESGPYLDSLGMVLLKLGKLDEALAAYDQAIAKMRAPASYMGRAFAYARKSDKARADADRSAAVKQNPEVEAQFAEYGLKF